MEAASFVTAAESISLMRRSVGSSSLQPGVKMVIHKPEINNSFFAVRSAVESFFISSMMLSIDLSIFFDGLKNTF
jgi:hypothetical protein